MDQPPPRRLRSSCPVLPSGHWRASPAALRRGYGLCEAKLPAARYSRSMPERGSGEGRAGRLGRRAAPLLDVGGADLPADDSPCRACRGFPPPNEPALPGAQETTGARRWLAPVECGGRGRQVRRRERSQVDPAKPATLMARSKRVEGSGTGLASVMTRIQSPGSVTLAVSAIWFPKRR